MNKYGPKRQHYIPICYLDAFLDKNTPNDKEPYVWLYEKSKKTFNNKSPKTILKQTHLYTLYYEGEKDYSIEKKLSTIEGRYKKVLEKINNEELISNDEHKDLCNFVAVMMLRTPMQKKRLKHMFNQLQEQLSGEALADNLKKDIESMVNGLDDFYKTNIINQVPHISDIFYKMNIAFFVSGKKSYFITSDDPVNRFNPELQWMNEKVRPGVGLAQKKVEVTIPLSPKIMACFTWTNIRGYLNYDKQSTNEINRMIYQQSDKYIVSHRPKMRWIWKLNFPLDIKFLLKLLKHKFSSK